jgi:hypothetical protein
MPDNATEKGNMLEIIKACAASALGITSSPSTTLDITIDITEKNKRERALGQMVYFILEEDGRNILVIGQIISIETTNRWHEDPSFKGVIKRHESLPHLSEVADNRVATISVQACYNITGIAAESYILGTSPSTGEKVQKMSNTVMKTLMRDYESYITYIGKVYGTDVNLPFWFKHFGKTVIGSDELGSGDAFHIGVFGKTGSGKTVTSTYMLLGYAKNEKSMSILILDPQGQFYSDQELLPGSIKLEDNIKKLGMNYQKLKILEDVFLPANRFDIFSELLKNNGFVAEAFGPFYNPDKLDAMADSISSYLDGRTKDPTFSLASAGPEELLKAMVSRFQILKYKEEKEAGFSKYITDVYGTKSTQQRLLNTINNLMENLATKTSVLAKWRAAIELFSQKKPDSKTGKKSIDDIVDSITKKRGEFMILDIGPKQGEIENENVQALFIKVLEDRIVEVGADLYVKGQKSNCLIVMDEAHRFITSGSEDERIKALRKSIVDAVRTTRKYGIGYMFITQTLESLDEEILRQMRIFAFGYGLTSGQELRKVAEIVNNPSAMQLYKSFIDPSSNQRYPFMFFGPISPLSFTGSPLFIEAYTNFEEFT